ncbi:MAG: hypothetical protein GY774_25065, partial [Planctomycetes bacterium]|nr:hypothetical protein [Planctomycetota bacterium]
LLQRLAFQTAESGSLGDIASAVGKKIVNIAGVKIHQDLLFGLFIWQFLKTASMI